MAARPSPAGRRLHKSLNAAAKRARDWQSYQLKQKLNTKPGLLRGLQGFAQAPLGAAFGSPHGAFGSFGSAEDLMNPDAGSMVIPRGDAFQSANGINNDAIPYSAQVQAEIAAATTDISPAAAATAQTQAALQKNEPWLRVVDVAGILLAGAAFALKHRPLAAGLLAATTLDIALRKSVDGYRAVMLQPWNTKVL